MRKRKLHPIAQGYFWLADRLYNELAPIYDPVSWMVSLGQWDIVRKWALDYLIGPCILEIGFGTGELLLEMARRKLQVFGLDSSAAMQRITNEKLRHRGLPVPCIQGRAQQMPFTGNSFDTIIATFPAGYIFDLKTWQEAARVLRQPNASTGACGGRFIVVGIRLSIRGKLFPPVTRSLFGLPRDVLHTHFKQLEQLTHLELCVVMRKHMGLEIPILIAEKRI